MLWPTITLRQGAPPMKFTVVTSLGEMRIEDGSYEVGPAGVLTVHSDGHTTVLSPFAWLRITHESAEPSRR
jgi:hypothetical protein